jgi:Tol biopolymer transport system component
VYTGTFGIYAADYYADPTLLFERQSQPFFTRSPGGTRLAIVWGGLGPDTPGIQVLSTERPEPFRLAVETRAIFGVSWTPDGSEFAFTAFRGNEIEVWVHTPANGRSRRLDGLGSVRQVAWTPDGSRLVVGADRATYAVPRSGGIALPMDREEAYELDSRQWGTGRDSADGRYEVFPDVEPFRPATPTPTAVTPSTPQGRLPSFGLVLRDRRSGSERALTTPDRGYDVGGRWGPDSRHFVATRSSCWACDGGTRMLVLVDVLTGKQTALTDGFEVNTGAIFSPDGQRILVTGKRLRVYSVDGALLWWVQPPDGQDVRDAVWGTSGQRIIYATGPAGYTCCI